MQPVCCRYQSNVNAGEDQVTRTVYAQIRRDVEANVFCVSDSNVPGLNAEVETVEETHDVFDLVPCLPEANEIFEEQDAPSCNIHHEGLTAHRRACYSRAAREAWTKAGVQRKRSEKGSHEI